MYCRSRGCEPLTCYMRNDIAVFCRLYCWGGLKMCLFREVELVVATVRSSCRRWERPPVEIKSDIVYDNCEEPIVWSFLALRHLALMCLSKLNVSGYTYHLRPNFLTMTHVMDNLCANFLSLCGQKGTQVRVSEVSLNTRTVGQRESVQGVCSGHFSKMIERCQSDKICDRCCRLW